MSLMLKLADEMKRTEITSEVVKTDPQEVNAKDERAKREQKRERTYGAMGSRESAAQKQIAEHRQTNTQWK